MRVGIRSFLFVALMALAACGPQLGSLHRGETRRVVRVINGDTLQLDSGLRVFLAEVDAPRRDEPYASQAYGELEALALHRNVLLAYGAAQGAGCGMHVMGSRSRIRRNRVRHSPAKRTPPPSRMSSCRAKAARFWLQNAPVARGAVMVRPRFDNHARTAELLNTEAQARATSRGLWAQPAYQPLAVRAAAMLAVRSSAACTRGMPLTA
jgi:endonuclease YncB( thermonuclease family)